MAERKGLMDNHNLDMEITYQEKIGSLSSFIMELRRTALKPENKYMADRAIEQLTEIALYVNKIELDNVYLLSQVAMNNVKLKKLLEQCLKN